MMQEMLAHQGKVTSNSSDESDAKPKASGLHKERMWKVSARSYSTLRGRILGFLEAGLLQEGVWKTTWCMWCLELGTLRKGEKKYKG